MRSGDHGSGRGAALVADLRAHSLVGFAHQAEHLRRVWAITRHVHAQESYRLGDASRGDALGCGRITEHDLDVQAAAEVAAATGLSTYWAEQDVILARALCTRLTGTLGALEAGRIDVARARTMAEHTSDLTDRQARKVEAVVLDGLPAPVLDGTGTVGPWDGPTPERFTRRVTTAVAALRREDEEQVRDEVRRRTGISVWTHPENPALSTMTVTGPTELVQTIAATCQARVSGLSRDELAGRTRGMAELDLLFDAVCDDGTGPAGRAGGRVQREVGVVITLDTLTSDDATSHSTGEVRGNGTPVPVTAAVARVVADQALDRGASTCVLLTDRDGRLTRFLRIGRVPERRLNQNRSAPSDPACTAEATRAAAPHRRLHAHGRDRGLRPSSRPRLHLPRLLRPRLTLRPRPHHPPPPRTDVGPEPVPRSRRCHRYKTAALWHCRTLTNSTGTVTAHEWTSPLGTRQVVEVEPLPGG